MWRPDRPIDAIVTVRAAGGVEADILVAVAVAVVRADAVTAVLVPEDEVAGGVAGALGAGGFAFVAAVVELVVWAGLVQGA